MAAKRPAGSTHYRPVAVVQAAHTSDLPPIGAAAKRRQRPRARRIRLRSLEAEGDSFSAGEPARVGSPEEFSNDLL